MFALRPAALRSGRIRLASLGARPSPSAATTARDASTLVVSEPSHESTAPASTLSAITAATLLDGGTGDITLLTLTDSSHPPVDPATLPSSVKTILCANVESGSLLAETVANAVKAATECGTFTHVLAASSKFGANFVPRAGALLGVSPVPDVIEILDEGEYNCTVISYIGCEREF